MFCFVITRNSNREISTKNLVNCKGLDGAKGEKI